ncbi:MAG: hypothetical protein V4480_05020 [Patescibacteria group bacterium]
MDTEDGHFDLEGGEPTFILSTSHNNLVVDGVNVGGQIVRGVGVTLIIGQDVLFHRAEGEPINLGKLKRAWFTR